MGIFYTVLVVMLVLFEGSWGDLIHTTDSTEQLWCVAKPGATDVELQDAISYVCTAVGADCSPIQAGGMCQQPDSLYNHASFIMNRYYQSKGRNTWDCSFGGNGMIACNDPSHGTCTFDHP